MDRRAESVSGVTGAVNLRNARIVLPDAVVEGDLAIAGGRIAEADVPGAAEIDLDGDYLLPGLIDLHTDNIELFYVIAGTASILAGEDWLEAPAGSFVRIPASVMHDFENRTDARVGLLNVFLPGGFEENMPAIVRWFADNP